MNAVSVPTCSPRPTERQLRFLRLLSAGCNYREIAQHCQFTEEQVQRNIDELKQYLGAAHILEALAIAERSGWL